VQLCCYHSPSSTSADRSKSADVAAQCGVVDEKVLQALQRIDDAVEAEVSGLPEPGLVEGHCLPVIASLMCVGSPRCMEKYVSVLLRRNCIVTETRGS